MPLSYFRRLRFSRGALWWSVAAPWMALAQTTAPTDAPAPNTDMPLPTITVTSPPLARPREGQINPTRAITTLGLQTIERRQPDSVFQLLDDVPGVSVNGGPRASGMSFNIRGYTDNEDVAVTVDGVAKGFEKYRFGGTFIEPDLLKSIEVRRGASIENAGALGGSVAATTKDGTDLLRPGQRLGGRVRAGWGSNNDERHTFAAVYGLASDTLDWVAAHSQRQGRNLMLPSGQRLDLSATDSGSSLLKARWFPNDQWQVSGSWMRYADQGLQAYDANSAAPLDASGKPSGFGQVLRHIKDDTLSLRAQWQDADRANAWKLTVGQSHTKVHDFMPKGYSTFSSAFDTDDHFRYKSTTLDTQGTWRLLTGPASQMDLHLGLQWGLQQRKVTRVTSDEAFNQSVYPDGFNRAQPSGTKTTKGLFLQPDWRWGRLQVLPGLRWDEVAVNATGKTIVELNRARQASTVTYQRTTPSLNLSFDLVPQRWTTFAQIGQAFRPPLVDEVFTQGPYGRCLNYLLVGGPNPLPGYTTGLNASQVAPSSGICGDLYRPETSRTLEWGLSLRQPGFLGQGVAAKNQLSAKLTLFRNRTDHLLESIMAQSGGSGAIVQEGWERRHGAELEAMADIGPAFSSLTASRIRGDAFDGRQPQPLTTAPADSVNWSLGWRWTNVEAMVRWQHVHNRLTTVGTVGATNVVGTQAGYHLLGLSLRWRVNPHLNVNLSGDNLANESYSLSNGFGGGQGTEAAGRNVRVALTAIY